MLYMLYISHRPNEVGLSMLSTHPVNEVSDLSELTGLDARTKRTSTYTSPTTVFKANHKSSNGLAAKSTRDFL